MEIKHRKETINWFNGLEKLSLFHISDTHLWYSTSILEKLEVIITTHNPDLIILTGDYYDIPKGALNFRDFLCKVSKKYTVLFIKGNHDKIYGTKISNLLLNIPNCYSVENSIYKHESKKGYSYNITSWQNRQKLPQNKCEKNIVLIHNPEKLKAKNLSNIQLILAGHLHGGQFVFFKTMNNSNFPGSIFYKFCTDRKTNSEHNINSEQGVGRYVPLSNKLSERSCHNHHCLDSTSSF